MKKLAVAVSIAGSDSGGGAGIQADLKTFTSLGVHGTSAITCITAQNPRRILAVQPCRAELVRAQLEAIFAEWRPTAVKVGMLYSGKVIIAVARFFRRRRLPPLVIDPVMVASSGACLLPRSAMDLLVRDLLPSATLVTPNLDEATLLAGRALRSVEDMRWAARELHRRFQCAVLVKGGHLTNLRQAADIFYDGANELLLTAPRISGLRTHGTGCTYSAAITAYLALGHQLPDAVARAKQYITQAIAQSQRAGQHPVLNTQCR